MYTAIIWHTKNCMKCKVTAMQLKPLPVEMKLIDRANGINTEIIDHMDSLNMMSAPLVRIYKDGDEVDEWNDFNIRKIKHWKGILADGEAKTASSV